MEKGRNRLGEEQKKEKLVFYACQLCDKDVWDIPNLKLECKDCFVKLMEHDSEED